MKLFSFIGTACVALAVSTLAASCQKEEQPTISQTSESSVTALIGYGMVEENSMVATKALSHTEVLSALQALLPPSLSLTATPTTTGTAVTFQTGTPATFKALTYNVTGTTPNEDWAQLGSYGGASAEPIVNVSTKLTIDESQTAYTIPAVYKCFALVAPAAQVASFQASVDGKWTTLPSAVSGDYRVAFVKGDYVNVVVNVNPASEDYALRQITMPSSSTGNGKYYYLELTGTGIDASVGLSFSDWISSTI